MGAGVYGSGCTSGRTTGGSVIDELRQRAFGGTTEHQLAQPEESRGSFIRMWDLRSRKVPRYEFLGGFDSWFPG